ncbi:MAG: hypothetical protein ABIT76_00080 [Chthoniobacterales bacterium]
MSHPEGSNRDQRQNGNGNGQRNDSNGHHNGDPDAPPTNGTGRNGYTNGRSHRPGTPVSAKQLDLINRIIRENNADRTEVETTAVEMFGVGLRELNSTQASNLIDKLFGGKSRGRQAA